MSDGAGRSAATVEGVRATVSFRGEPVCPIADLSARAGTTVDTVSAAVCLAESTEGALEFSADTDADVDVDTDATPVFSYGDTGRYRLERGRDGVTCPCECLGAFGCSVAEYTATDGTVTLVFHAADYDELRAVVADLRERFSGVTVERFVQSAPGGNPGDPAFVDRSRLTSRQLEVARTAYEMGYFERPRAANATEVADALDISRATFTQHLTAVQAKLFEDLLGRSG
jgi:predicted DNA binding protein